jgi:hypothetical protein
MHVLAGKMIQFYGRQAWRGVLVAGPLARWEGDFDGVSGRAKGS